MRVKVCYKCHEFIPIIENSYLNNTEVIVFDRKHFGHPVQIVSKEDLENMGNWKMKLESTKHLIESQD